MKLHFYSDKGAEQRDRRYQEAVEEYKRSLPNNSDDISVSYTPVPLLIIHPKCVPEEKSSTNEVPVTADD
jgi:hypothetical protein